MGQHDDGEHVEQRVLGVREQQVLDAFGKNRDKWNWTSYDQYAPGGDKLIGALYMLICPVCYCLVCPSPEEDKRPVVDWPTLHIEYHLDLARALDQR